MACRRGTGFAVVGSAAAGVAAAGADGAAPKTVMERVEKLEQSVESLVALPGLVTDLAVRTGNLESQFLQLRSECRDGFSSIRAEISGRSIS